jgi:hypothetical protein
MHEIKIDDLTAGVQRNCHRSDSRHGSDYGLCTYLLRMREFFRWEHRLAFADVLDKDAVGEWLEQRERLWSELGESDFEPVAVGGHAFDPFDHDSINDLLIPHGLIYSGGIGASGKPHFFLAELEEQERRNGYRVYVTGRELARDLASPPAMSLQDTIFIRRESLRRMLWEKLDSWRWHRPDNALGRAFSEYNFEQSLEDSLEQMTDHVLELTLLHEQGECDAARVLGHGWNDFLAELSGTPAELAARAVRDHLADSLSTLPSMARIGRSSTIHFYFGNLSGMRKEIFPQLQSAYGQWLEEADFAGLEQLANHARSHWSRLAGEMIALGQSEEEDLASAVMGLVRQNYL